MWRAPPSILCLAALPLIGCAGEYTPRQAVAVALTPVAYTATFYAASPRVYRASSAAPAAVLVFLPGVDIVPSDPALWGAQGFDVVLPQPADMYRVVADQEAAMARLVASAEAPIWLVGPGQVVEAAIPHAGGRISGVIVTSASSPTFSCRESFSYYNPGTGAHPQVKVTRSGDCGAAVRSITGGEPSVLQPIPAQRPHAPRIIEASTMPKGLPPAAQAQRLAELIKGSPAS